MAQTNLTNQYMRLFESFFGDLYPEIIIPNGYVVLNSIFDEKRPINFSKRDFEKELKKFQKNGSIMEMTKKRISYLKSESLKNEEVFLALVTQGQSQINFENQIERIKAFSSYLKLQKFYGKSPTNEDNFLEPMFTATSFRKAVVQGLRNALEEKEGKGLGFDNYKEYFANSVGEAIKGYFRDNHLIEDFERENSDIMEDLINLYGKKTFYDIIKKYNPARKTKNIYAKDFKLSEGGTYGLVNEWAVRNVGEVLDEDLPTRYTTIIENTGMKKRKVPRIISHKLVVKNRGKKNEKLDYRKISTIDEVSQKSDNEITVIIENNPNPDLTYKVLVSNKFRSGKFNFGKDYEGDRSIQTQKAKALQIALDGNGNFNSQIPRFSEFLGDNFQEIIPILTFVLLNTASNAIFTQNKNEIEFFLQQISAAFMFDNVGETLVDPTSNSRSIYLFQINRSAVPLSIILESLEIALDQQINSRNPYISLAIDFKDDPLDLYQGIENLAAPATQKATYIRDTLLTKSSFKTEFNGNLLNNIVSVY